MKNLIVALLAAANPGTVRSFHHGHQLFQKAAIIEDEQMLQVAKMSPSLAQLEVKKDPEDDKIIQDGPTQSKEQTQFATHRKEPQDQENEELYKQQRKDNYTNFIFNNYFQKEDGPDDPDNHYLFDRESKQIKLKDGDLEEMQAKASISFQERKRNHKEKKDKEARLQEHIKLEQRVISEAQTIMQGIEEQKAKQQQQQPTNQSANLQLKNSSHVAPQKVQVSQTDAAKSQDLLIEQVNDMLNKAAESNDANQTSPTLIQASKNTTNSTAQKTDFQQQASNASAQSLSIADVLAHGNASSDTLTNVETYVSSRLNQERQEMQKNQQELKKTKVAKKVVHLIPHSHTDEGWLSTVDDFFTGEDDWSIYIGCVRDILDSTVEEMLLNETRTFTFAEIKYFKMWWDHQEPDLKVKVKQLVKSGRLDLVSGGWSAPDEAITGSASKLGIGSGLAAPDFL